MTSKPGQSDCIGYWHWAYNIIVYWGFPIHLTNFEIEYKTIQFNIKDNKKDDDQGDVKHTRGKRIDLKLLKMTLDNVK